MSKRGRVLRDPSANSPGLLILEGQQYSFSLEGTWRSLTLPKPGMDVDVELDQHGAISSLAAISEAQVAREQAERALDAVRQKSSAFAASAMALFGMPTVVATGVLVLSWFFLTAVTYEAGFAERLPFTFWHVLGLLNSSRGIQDIAAMSESNGAGIYGVLALAALGGPFMKVIWHDPRALLGGVLPLAFMLLVTVHVESNVYLSTRGMPSEFVEAAQAEIGKGFSVGPGTYSSALAALFLGFSSVRTFLAARRAKH